MAQIYNSQLDAFDLYHKTHESQSPSISGGPALPALGHAIAGSAGAAISNVITYPLDLIITRLQIQRQLRKDSSTPHDNEYKSIRDAAQKICAQEDGLLGLYTGVLQDTSKTIADAFLFFLAYNFLRQSRLRSQKHSSKHLPAIEELSVGFLAGAFSKLLTTPISNIVTRKQTSSMIAARDPGGSRSKSQTVRAIAKEFHTEKGLQGFWSGYSASLVLTLNPSLTFFFYETFKRILLPRAQRANPPPQATFFLAAVSKAIASSITYPFSLAKSRAQVSSSKVVDQNDEEVKDTIEKASDGATGGTRRGRKAVRTTIFSSILHIARTEGVGALYEGLAGEVMKGFFSHGITMIVKEAIHKIIIRLYFTLLKVLKRYPSPHEAVEAAKNQASGSIESIKAGVVTAQQKGQSLAQEGSARIADAYTSTKSAAKVAGTSVQNSMDSTTNHVSDAVGGAYDKVREAGTKAIGAASATTQSAAHSAKSTVTAATGQASEAAREAYNASAKTISSAKDTTVSAVQSSKESVRSSVTTAVGQTSEAAAETYKKAREVGGQATGKANDTVEPVAEYVGRKTQELGRSIRPSKGDNGT
ncbi:hypothetical protein MMC30_001666 [Trapelia coarctata]|nr:hypothetical protein [Trapelia coarctata]